MVNGTPGWKGYYLSAYGLAVKRGYPGTEEEWLDSLHGADVEMRYENGELQWKHDTSEEWHTLEEFTVLQELLEQRSERAQAAAELAEEKAQTAGTAATAANTAAGAANSAAAAANTATSTVSKAKEEAEAAAEAAETAAEEANTAAEAATVKAQAAELAASGANTAAAEAQTAKAEASAAAGLANGKASAAETAAGQANAAAQAAQEAKTAANTAAGLANAAAETAQTQGNYAKAQGDRAAQLVDAIEDTDVGGMAADILALQSGKADLVNGKVPDAQLPELDFDPAGSAAAVQALISAHTGNTANPHGVTAAQIGVTAKRTCTFVVGTSTAGWTAADCDYLCDGVDDQVEIQAALNSLPDSGGKIVLLEGEYFSNQHFEISKNITLCGSGNMSILTVDGNFTAIETSSDSSFFRLSNLQLKGVNNTAFPVVKIHSNNVMIDNCYFSAGGFGIQVDWGSPVYIVGNRFTGIAYNAVTSTTGEIFLLNNHVFGTNTGFSAQNAYGSPVMISGNLFYYGGSINVANTTAALICSNALICSGNIYFEGSDSYAGNGSSISGNILYNMRGRGIRLSNAISVTVQGNVIYKAEGYTSSEYPIEVFQGSNNVICNNYMPGKNYYLENSDGSKFVNNIYE